MLRRLLVAFLVLGALVAGAVATVGAAGETVRTGGNAALGSFLVGPNDMTLYLFLKDEPNKSNCTGNCLINWPPLTVAAGETPSAAMGVPGKLGVMVRDDGVRQVTYNSWPLYYWKNDAKVGDSTGQDVGKVWFVVKTDTVALSGAALGSYLVGDNAMTLYYFTKDTRNSGKSVCKDACAKNWPPLTVASGAVPTAGAGVLGTVGVIRRDDGAHQVTYNGWPLYYWAKDIKPGDTTGNAVGDVWFTVDPNFSANDYQKMLNRQSVNERLIQILQTVSSTLSPELKAEFESIESSYLAVVAGTADIIEWQTAG